MGFGELMVVFIIVVIVFGAAGQPSLGERLQRLVERRAWTRSEWLLIMAVGALGLVMAGLTLRRI
jgi:Sec-independent protein translocase protein TatA